MRRLWETAARHPDQQLVLYELTCLSLQDPALAGMGKWQYEWASPASSPPSPSPPAPQPDFPASASSLSGR